MENEKALQLANMAKEIAEKLGVPVIEEGSYGDTYQYRGYTYEKLMIQYFDQDWIRGSVAVYFDQIRVLYYDPTYKRVDLLEGKWKDLMNVIYQNVPVVQEKRNKEKLNILKTMERECKYIGRTYRSKQEVYEYLTNRLSEDGIFLTEEKSEDRTTFFVYYNENPVLEFTDSELELFPNIERYMNRYTSEGWENLFKLEVLKSQRFEESLSEKKESFVKTLK